MNSIHILSSVCGLFGMTSLLNLRQGKISAVGAVSDGIFFHAARVTDMSGGSWVKIAASVLNPSIPEWMHLNGVRSSP